jgi:hypothetical protein
MDPAREKPVSDGWPGTRSRGGWRLLVDGDLVAGYTLPVSAKLLSSRRWGIFSRLSTVT